MGRDRFRILAVCTGNVCRSPMVERLLRHRLSEIDEDAFDVRSVGTHALVGDSVTPDVARLLTGMGAPSDGFAARQLTPSILSSVDLVLTLTRAHRAKVLELRPALLSRTFTLREFARMVCAAQHTENDTRWPVDSVSKWKTLLPIAASYRHTTLTPGRDDDVTDPYGLGQAAYSLMAAEILPAVEVLAQFERLAGSSARVRAQGRSGQ